MARNRRKLLKGVRAQKLRTLANFHESLGVGVVSALSRKFVLQGVFGDSFKIHILDPVNLTLFLLMGLGCFGYVFQRFCPNNKKRTRTHTHTPSTFHSSLVVARKI